MNKPRKSITQEELNEIIERHQHYLKRDVPDWEDCRAFFPSDVNYEDMNFSYADLTEVVFNHTWLVGADFSHARLCGCKMNNVYADGTNFRSADMQSATIDQGQFYLADFREADLSRACLENFDQNVRGSHHCCFDQANLSLARLGGNFSEASFRRANLTEANIDHADFTLCDFQNAALAHSVFEKTTVHGTYFRNTDLSFCTFQGCRIRNASFKSADLHNTLFVDTSMNNIDFTKANLTKAELGECRWLNDCDFSLADLTDADFCKGDLEDDLFLDCDFSDAKTDGMKLDLERFCKPIGLPEGFGKTDIDTEEPTSNGTVPKEPFLGVDLRSTPSNGVNLWFTPGNECKTFVPSRDEEDLERG